MFSAGDAYERFMGRWSRLVAPSLVEFAGVRDDDAVLDVGCGTGMLSFAMANASVVGIDSSAAYVELATRSATPRVRFEVGTAEQLGFDDATFDRTLSMFVLNFVPDPARALAEMVRVTKPRGVIAAAVWDYADGMEMLRLFWDEAVALDPSIASRDEAHMPLGKRGELAALWRARGLDNVTDTGLTITQRFASFDDYWQPFLLGQGPAGAYVASFPDDRRRALADRLRARIVGDGDRRFALQARAWAVRGVVPS